jgi:hypothetical protein
MEILAMGLVSLGIWMFSSPKVYEHVQTREEVVQAGTAACGEGKFVIYTGEQLVDKDGKHLHYICKN